MVIIISIISNSPKSKAYVESIRDLAIEDDSIEYIPPALADADDGILRDDVFVADPGIEGRACRIEPLPTMAPAAPPKPPAIIGADAAP